MSQLIVAVKPRVFTMGKMSAWMVNNGWICLIEFRWPGKKHRDGEEVQVFVDRVHRAVPDDIPSIAHCPCGCTMFGMNGKPICVYTHRGRMVLGLEWPEAKSVCPAVEGIVKDVAGAGPHKFNEHEIGVLRTLVARSFAAGMVHVREIIEPQLGKRLR